jgi:hypothetical protein
MPFDPRAKSASSGGWLTEFLREAFTDPLQYMTMPNRPVQQRTEQPPPKEILPKARRIIDRSK